MNNRGKKKKKLLMKKTKKVKKESDGHQTDRHSLDGKSSGVWKSVPSSICFLFPPEPEKVQNHIVSIGSVWFVLYLSAETAATKRRLQEQTFRGEIRSVG